MTETTRPALDRSQLMVAYWMKAELTKLLKDHEPQLKKELGEGDSASARFDLDGQELPLGKITRTEPKMSWRVTNATELLEWATENLPELVETVVQLKGPEVADLIKDITRQNAAITPDGEIIPGITWGGGSTSSLRYTPAKDISDKLGLLQREGRLGDLTSSVLSLEAGDDAAG